MLPCLVALTARSCYWALCWKTCLTPWKVVFVRFPSTTARRRVPLKTRHPNVNPKGVVSFFNGNWVCRGTACCWAPPNGARRAAGLQSSKRRSRRWWEGGATGNQFASAQICQTFPRPQHVDVLEGVGQPAFVWLVQLHQAFILCKPKQHV